MSKASNHRHLPIGALLMAAVLPVMTASGANSGVATGDELEEVVITGTNLRGVAPVGSTVTTISREDIETSGAITALEVIRQQPQISLLGISDNQRIGAGGGSNIMYASSINLRGIAPGATLTLVNGHRVAPAGTQGQAPDPQFVPTIMLERVDVVADGASATYGSDAVAGVVNLVMRRSKSDALEASAYAGVGAQYNETQYGALFAHNWGSGQLTIGAQYAHHTALNGADRSFFLSDLTSRGGTDYRSTQCSPGNIIIGGVSYAIPAGGVTTATNNLLVANTQNKCDIFKNDDLIPEQTNRSIALTFDQDVSSAVHLFGDAYFARREFARLKPQATANVTVSSTNPYFVAPRGTTVTSETVAFWYGNQGLGNSYTASGTEKNYQVTGGGEVKLGGDWRLAVQATVTKDTDLQLDTRFNTTAAQAAINSTVPGAALNPFGVNSAALLAPLQNTLFNTPGFSSIRYYDAKFDGPLWTMPAGQVKAAVGYEYEWREASSGTIGGTPQVPVPALSYYHRTVNSFWGEALVPFFSKSNARPGLQSLEVSLGARTANYSAIGRSTNPKIGVNWKPIDDLLVHASAGRSFRAPLFSEIYVASQNVTNTLYALPTGGSGSGYQLALNSLDIKPETAKTWSVGADWTPAAVPGLKLSLGYFNINYKDQIANNRSTTILLNAALYSQIVTLCPSQACTDLYNKYIAASPPPLPIVGLVISNPVAFVNAASFNAGGTTTDGLDFTLALRGKSTRAGTFGAQLAGTYFLSYKSAVTSNAPVLDLLNTIGNPIQLRMRGSLYWDKGPWSSHLDVNYTGSYKNTLSTPVQSVSAWTTVDLSLVHRFDSESRLFNGLTVGLNAKNVLDKDPPFVNIAPTANGGGGYDPQAATEIGRVVGVSISKRL